MTACMTPGCPNKLLARGLCRTCYRKFIENRDPIDAALRRLKINDRIPVWPVPDVPCSPSSLMEIRR